LEEYMNIGIGAMLHYLGGGSAHDPSEYVGQTILAAKLDDDKLLLDLSSGKRIAIWDNGQSCCEHRYMSTDDEVESLVGHKLARIEAKPGPDEPDEWDEHETCFVEVATDVGFITLVNHNEHNGFYGGFGLTITEEAKL
jgi:hypothetical protein